MSSSEVTPTDRDFRGVDALLKNLSLECHDFGTPIPTCSEVQRQQLAMLGPLFLAYTGTLCLYRLYISFFVNYLYILCTIFFSFP